ncbi:MBL fold metallo-hydrolase [Halomonas sp. MCCC 1A11062]|uniref:MBL fold metallo-hydrolase n=1 Tax=Halomonas sp. MCCC 1A11062 TaxID=2733485 RepID=UPI001F2E037B|nr:MBL fold metallo-hydrolase [Halomonas sp. MCCC 1A11062]MCE8036519.1 AAA family ATPase [Halomonas sp. MCCC 1A11062]
MSEPMPPDTTRVAALLELLERHTRVLLTGPPGSGKSTLVRSAAAALAERGQVCRCLAADPGLPGFGPPGAVCLGHWDERLGRWDERLDDWHLEAIEALATLDSARFRLPLIEAVRRMVARLDATPLLIDAPGVERGIGGAELLPALANAGRVSAVVRLAPAQERDPYPHERTALGLATLNLPAHPQARHPGKQLRRQWRTGAWDAYLDGAETRELDLSALIIVGAPPPGDAPHAWPGRQVGLLDVGGTTLAMGEVVALVGDLLSVRTPPLTNTPRTLVIRDARRNAEGQLGTARPHPRPSSTASGEEPTLSTTPQENTTGPRPTLRLNGLRATLVNGVFGDPLLHLRLRHRKRSLLFDLGDPGRLPARLAHQISDVFISHAHVDHIGGFLWLLRSRIGDYPACRVYGPPGLATHLDGFLRGILWDRVEEKAPRFEVFELHGERLAHYRLVAGQPMQALSPREVDGGVIHAEPGFRVRAATLDHGTPVLAFAYEPATQLKVRKERLDAHGWAPGPWLGELKQRALEGDDAGEIALPDGSRHPVAGLAEQLLFAQPGQRLVYATDFGDTPENRERLCALAHGAEVLFCEASFREDQAEQARRTGHLTARACGEIAAAARVGQLVPFHFSRRHVEDVSELYAEIRRHFPRLAATPGSEPHTDELD